MAWVKLLYGLGGVTALVGAVAGDIGLREPAVAGMLPAPEWSAPPRVSVVRSADGLFYLSGEINGAAVRFLVDTGASVTALTKRDAARAGVQAGGGAPVRLRTAAGHGQMRWARMARIRVGDHEMRNLDVAVVARDLPVSLLGQNVLTRMGAVTIVGNELHLH